MWSSWSSIEGLAFGWWYTNVNLLCHLQENFYGHSAHRCMRGPRQWRTAVELKLRFDSSTGYAVQTVSLSVCKTVN